MDARQEWAAEAVTEAAHEHMQDEVWLLGQPPLQDYVDYVQEIRDGGTSISRKLLVDLWRVANDYYYELEVSEAGLADRAEVRELPPSLAPVADTVMIDARFRRAFDKLPTRFAMVELDKLVVSQLHVDLNHAERLKARLGRAPSPESLFRFCHPLGGEDAPLQIRRVGPDRFVFWSASSDLRFHEALLLHPNQISGYEAFGPVGGIVSLVVGFGSNFLNVIQSDNRVLLQNGYHRAYALRDLGITHAPCIVQTVTRLDELNLAAGRKVRESPAFYFKAARPPLLKDFFDPKIRTVLRVPRVQHMIEVSFEVKEYDMKDFGPAG